MMPRNGKLWNQCRVHINPNWVLTIFLPNTQGDWKKLLLSQFHSENPSHHY